MSRINPLAPDYHAFHVELEALLKYGKAIDEPKQLCLLHCDYIGRNILVDSDHQVAGVIDFDAARIGDAVYDLAKIVWVDIDFSDLELRNAVLAGWECSYKQSVPKMNFLYYVGIQCLAAIAWADKHLSCDQANVRFRAAAIRTLKLALKELETL